MPSYRDLLARTKAEISEIDAPAAHERLADEEILFLDVREAPSCCL